MCAFSDCLSSEDQTSKNFWKFYKAHYSTNWQKGEIDGELDKVQY